MKEPVAEYSMFKGLQRPLEIFGIRGRFIVVYAIAILTTFIGCLVGFIAFGTGTGFTILAILLALNTINIIRQRKTGLHRKKKHKGIFVFKTLYSR